MNSSSMRINFHYVNYDEIQTRINDKRINAFDIIYTKDTHENILISPQLEICPIRSKVYRFTDIAKCEEFLNASTDTYEGQIVAIMYNNTYTAYIVNKNSMAKFYVTPLGSSSGVPGEVDYNNLGNRPIVNLVSDISNPVIVDEQADGVYKITGSYKISTKLNTVFSSVDGNLYVVEHSSADNKVYVKVITAKDITDYQVASTGEVVTSTTPTQEWLTAQGYATEGYVDGKIAALDLITRKEVEAYVSDVVLKNIDTKVSEEVQKVIAQKIVLATEREVHEIFNKEFSTL